MTAMTRRAAAAWFCALAAGATLLLRPWRMGFPVNDDWQYWLGALNFSRGRFVLCDWPAATQVLHLAFGAAAIRLGAGLGAIKLLNMAWSAAAGLGVLWLALEVGAPPAAALLAACALYFSPLAVANAASFMTDPCCLALSTLALCCFTRGLRGDRWRLLAGGALSAAAFLVRQVGLLLPLAPTLVLLRRRRLDARAAAALWLPVVASAAVYELWRRFVHGPTVGSVAGAAAAFWSDPAVAIKTVLGQSAASSQYLGLLAAPLAAWRRPSGPRARRAALLALALAAAAFLLDERVPYLGNTLNRRGFGPSGALMTETAFWLKPAGFFAWPWLWPALGLAAAAGAAATAVSLSELPLSDPLVELLLLASAIQWGATLIKGSFFDRYLLMVLPGFLAILASRLRGGGLRVRLAAVAALAAFSLLGELDYAAWRGAAWSLGEAAVRRGARPGDVHGWLEWEGHWTYQPNVDRLKRERPLRAIGDWDWRTDPAGGWLVSFAANVPGAALLEEASYATPLDPAGGRLYLLRLSKRNSDDSASQSTVFPANSRAPKAAREASGPTSTRPIQR